MGLFSILFVTGLAVTLATGQTSCSSRLQTCVDVYYRSSYNQDDWNDFWNCVNPIDCTGDSMGQNLKNQLLESLSRTPIVSKTDSHDAGSMLGLSLVLGFVCLLLALNR
ncbi:hypothetical protein RRG08_057065 [Elysia crispata]|uniref:Uncharacterized protein n=1 Tax=Elysia crispata TaxID=231223 RepID=A0AAE1ALV9_9GAST|nr:hypothetical protein RRG08_057065 [Elysia crispata]